MGTKKSMLRNYLRLVGFSSVILGVIFLLTSMAASSRTLSLMGDYGFYNLEGSIINHVLYFVDATRGHLSSMINALALGGVCLYLSFRMPKNQN